MLNSRGKDEPRYYNCAHMCLSLIVTRFEKYYPDQNLVGIVYLMAGLKNNLQRTKYKEIWKLEYTLFSLISFHIKPSSFWV